MADEKTSLFDSFTAHILTTIVAAAGGIVVAYVTLQGTTLQADNAQREQLYERISELENRESSWRTQLGDALSEIGTLTAANALLRVQNSAGYALSPRAAIFAYLEALGLPAWIKVYEPSDDVFRMLYINREYENVYGITRAKYIGSTDADIYPPPVAKGFEKNDLETLERRGPQRVKELITLPDGSTHYWQFVKTYLRLPDGTEAVTGLQLTDPKDPEAKIIPIPIPSEIQ